MDKNGSNIVPLCEGRNDYCVSLIWEVILVAGAVLSSLFNIVHLIILLSLRSSRNTVYFLILKHMTVADIFVPVVHAIVMPCGVRRIMVQSRILTGVMNAIVYGCTVKYIILALGSVERAIALSMPLQYQTNWFISKLHIWLIVSWVSIPITSLVGNVLTLHNLCIDTVFGPGNSTTTLAIIMVGAFTVLPSIVLIIALSIVVYYIRQLSKFPIAQELHHRSSLTAARYITILSIIYTLMCSLPIALTFGIDIIPGVEYNPDIIALEVCLHSVYGIIDTLLYARMNESYRTAAKRFLTFRKTSAVTVMEISVSKANDVKHYSED